MCKILFYNNDLLMEYSEKFLYILGVFLQFYTDGSWKIKYVNGCKWEKSLKNDKHMDWAWTTHVTWSDDIDEQVFFKYFFTCPLPILVILMQFLMFNTNLNIKIWLYVAIYISSN